MEKDKWLALGLSPKTVEHVPFVLPTPIQQTAIPLILQHKDVVAEAVTGSGKTLAYLLPLIERILKGSDEEEAVALKAVVVSPTRELAMQIQACLEELHVVESVLLIGGVDIELDKSRLMASTPRVVIGTPGRLGELFKQGVVKTKAVDMLVLDEADRLLDLGFADALQSIIGCLPKQRRTALFSATMSDALDELIRTGLRNPVRVTVSAKEAARTPATLRSFYAICALDQKLACVLSLLKAQAPKKTIIYFATCACVDYFASSLNVLVPEMAWIALHGKLPSAKRTVIYNRFVVAERAVLLCTDVAARGLDFSDIEWVIQYDAPQDPKSFIHRCGRTARSGREGDAVVLLAPNESAYVDLMSIRNTPLSPLTPDFDGAGDLLERIKSLNSSDRAFYQKSMRAFVSFVRFYKEHHAQMIFQLKQLDFGAVARSFGLLHIPKMPEFSKLTVVGFEESDIDPRKVAYKDKVKERQRLEALRLFKEKQPEKKSGRKKAEAAWSKQKEHKRQKQKKKAKREALEKQRKLAAEAERQQQADLDELKEDWREYKRHKQQG